MTFRFIHAADLHLDTPFTGLAAADEVVADALRDASLDAFDELVEFSIRRTAAFVLLAGDIYDGESRGVRAQLRFLSGLERLSAAGIRVFIVHGNHDPLLGWSAIRNWPPGVTVFGHGDVEYHAVQINGRTLAHVYGISYAQPAVTENLALRFHRREGDGLHIGLLHCNVGNNTEHERYSPCDVEDLVRAGMDYWALGHIHRRPSQYPQNPWIVYPGNLQGRSSKPSECGPKGAVLVEADSEAVRSVEFVALDRARFVQAEVDIARIGDFAGLHQALVELAEQLREEHGQRLLLIRVLLTGSGQVHSDLDASRIGELVGELRRECAHGRPMLYWESILDWTTPEVNLASIRDRGDFLSEVLKYAESLGAEEARMQQLFGGLAAEMGRIPTRVLEKLDLLDDRTALDRALTLALDMLQREEGA